MRILRLGLENFMAYRGIHEVNFEVSDEAPIILFLGENGHGKSTIQHAARWCLYGETTERNLLIPESQLINRKVLAEIGPGETSSMSVSIRWSDSGLIFDLVRTWSFDKKSSPQSHGVLRIDGKNPVPESSIPEYVQRFLAKEISHFFFFNGEVQSEFDDMVSNSRSAQFIRNEIEKTLSIPVITDGIQWLNERKKIENVAIVKANKNDKKIAEADFELRKEEEVLRTLQEERTKCENHFELANSRIRTLEEEIGNIAAVQSLYEEISSLKGQRTQRSNDRRDKLGEIRDLLSTHPWIPDANNLLRLQRETQDSLSQAAKISSHAIEVKNNLELLERLRVDHICPLCAARHDDTPTAVEEKIFELKQTLESVHIPDVTALERKQTLLRSLNLQASVFTTIRNQQKEFDALGSELAKIEQSLSEKSNDLALHGNIDVKNAVISMKSLTEDRSIAQEGIKDYSDKIDESKRKMLKLETEISKGQGVSPEKKIAHAAYSYLSVLFEQGKDIYTRAVKDQVERYSSETFLKIISDKKYKGLRINDNYGVDLIMEDGQIDPLRSTGQGKVSTISLVSGLIRTAMPDGFILMDTPFVSLDLGHREQVCRWAAHSGLHVSLFMHSGEFKDENLMEFFEGRIGRIYRIRQVDLNESTIEVEV